MIITVLRARVREGLDAATLERLEAAGLRMAELAAMQPGFISYKDFAAPDGEAVTVVEFDTLENVGLWHRHPEHRAVQEWSRQVLFSEYQVYTCQVAHSARFQFAGGPAAADTPER